MDYSEIYEALKAKDFNWPICADAIGCSSSHVMNVAARRGESKTVAKKLAAIIGKPVQEVFPDKPNYHEDKTAKRDAKVSDVKALIKHT